MSQSRKTIKDYSAIYLDGLLLDTTALGNLKLGNNEVGSGSGTQGPIGLTGTQGPIGLTGTQGPIGLTGTQGPIGLTGTQGLIGLTGTMGPIGPEGTMGSIGLTGTMGPIGLTGTQGSIGLTGTMGPIGLTGTMGPIGPEGTIGSIGLTGTMGPIGLTGTMGPSGVTGSSFANLYVSESITTSSLIVRNEGPGASISESGVITCTDIVPGLFSPELTRTTQATSIITDIVISTPSQFGSIVTVSTALSTQSSTAFSVQNPFITPNTRVISNIINYNGTGLPSVYVAGSTVGSFTMTLQNNSISSDLSGEVEIGFMALK